MRIHTSLTATQLRAALTTAANKGGVAAHVAPSVLTEHRSQSRARAFEVKLATLIKVPGDHRRFRNSGNHGAGRIYAATYDEWGYFLAEVFALDPDALVPGHYDGAEDFHTRTKHAYATAAA